MDCCEQKQLLYLSRLPLQSQIMNKRIQLQCEINDFHEAELGFEVKRMEVFCSISLSQPKETARWYLHKKHGNSFLGLKFLYYIFT